MSTITALLMAGDPHPYDGGLWGDFALLALHENSRPAWVWKMGGEAPPAIPESPDRILEVGLDCLQGMTVKRVVQDIKVVLVIFKGSSLRPEPSRKILEARYNCFEIASSAFSRQLNPFDKLP